MPSTGWYRVCQICKVRYSRENNLKRKFMARFPLSAERCRAWVKNIGNEDLAYVPIEILHRSKYVCADHFKKKDFNKKGTRLKKRAVPSLKIKRQPLSEEILKGFPCHILKHTTPGTIELVQSFAEKMKSSSIRKTESDLASANKIAPDPSSAIKPVLDLHYGKTLISPSKESLLQSSHLNLGAESEDIHNITFEFQDFQEASSPNRPHLLSQRDLNDLVHDLNLSQKQAELLVFRLIKWNLLKLRTSVSNIHRPRVTKFKVYAR